MRLDVFLVQQGLAQTRTRAQELIERGFVTLERPDRTQKLQKPSFDISEADAPFVKIVENEIQKYVSRGGLKLESALRKLNIPVKDASVLDIGQSTGGFTDCVLELGAKKVVGLDVGHGQLHEKLRSDARVISFENLHIKNVGTDELFKQQIPSGGFDIVIMDVSFISITKTFSHLAPLLKLHGIFLFLVKPQFELTADDLDNNGIVKKPARYADVQKKVTEEARVVFGTVIDYIQSDLLGKDGNQEFFIYGKKSI